MLHYFLPLHINLQRSQNKEFNVRKTKKERKLNSNTWPKVPCSLNYNQVSQSSQKAYLPVTEGNRLRPINVRCYFSPTARFPCIACCFQKEPRQHNKYGKKLTLSHTLGTLKPFLWPLGTAGTSPGSRPLPRLSTSLSSPSVKALLLSATEEYDSGDFGHGSLRGSDSSDVTWPLNMDSSASLGFEGGTAAQVWSASALIFSVTDVFRQMFPKE